MVKKIIVALGIVLAVLGIWYVLATDRDEKSNDLTNTTSTSTEQTPTARDCVAEDCLDVEGLEYPVGQLPQEVVQTLNAALDDEYKARATYAAVLTKLGSVRPFSMIIRAEEQHISLLKALYDKYGIDIPADPYVNVEVADTRAANCSIGVQAEIDNAALYRDTLLAVAKNYPDIAAVFTKLMDASRENHLPAFEKCAE